MLHAHLAKFLFLIRERNLWLLQGMDQYLSGYREGQNGSLEGGNFPRSHLFPIHFQVPGEEATNL